MKPAYKRILLKLSGEALAGSKGTGLDNQTLHRLGETISKVVALGVE
ncbi:MAG: UMP kinase, partial [Clostridiaceae bacterium]|nr:UMP kinase [Clostridiaceae bacterium]